MANVIRETNTHVVIGMRLPRARFEQLIACHPTPGQALRAVRLMFDDAVTIALLGADASLPRSGQTADAPDQDEDTPHD